MSRDKIIKGLKDLAKLADQREIPLDYCVEKLNDLLTEVEELIESCKREKCKQKPFTPKNIKLG